MYTKTGGNVRNIKPPQPIGWVVKALRTHKYKYHIANLLTPFQTLEESYLLAQVRFHISIDDICIYKHHMNLLTYTQIKYSH